jgi:membrane protein
MLHHVLTRDSQKSSSRTHQKLSIRVPLGDLLYFLSVLKDSFRRAFDHDVFGIAKAAAYSSILTFFPSLLVLGTILDSSRRLEIYVGEICYALARILPVGSATAVQYLKNTTFHPVDFLIATSLLALWTASSAMVSWMEGFRKAYRLPKIWGIVKERLIACSLVILAEIPLMFATILIAFGRQIGDRLLHLVGHDFGPLILLWTGMRWLVASLTSVAVIALIYHNGIPRTRPWHTVIPGAVVATGLWFPVTALFGWYMHESTEYSAIYGFLGVGIALLVWLYVTTLVVLVGAEFNAIVFPRSLTRPAVA